MSPRAATILFLATCIANAQSFERPALFNVAADSVTYQGRKALHLTERPHPDAADTFAVVSLPDFGGGVIEIDLAGAPASGSAAAARGFIGVAFHLQAEPLKFELLYLRPTNGRADDQLRRNHSTQYVSFPDWPWERTRKETPGLYESYVDLQPAVWTKVKIVVSGATARLFVHGVEEPALIVNDLKAGATKGAIALWIGPGTDGYFSNLRVNPGR